jgi:hypothetical protein
MPGARRRSLLWLSLLSLGLSLIPSVSAFSTGSSTIPLEHSYPKTHSSAAPRPLQHIARTHGSGAAPVFLKPAHGPTMPIRREYCPELPAAT